MSVARRQNTGTEGSPDPGRRRLIVGVDVTAETEIARTRTEVADYAMDADRDSEWIGGIKESRTVGDGPLGPGSRAERVATFLGRRIEYVLEVTEYEPGRRIRMQTVRGPFPMDVTYEFEDRDTANLARIRVAGDASGFFKVMPSFLLARQVRQSITGDLANLKRIMESGEDQRL